MTNLRLLHSHPGLFIALPVYLIVALSYFFIVPIFEAPDEWTHTGHVKHIAEGNGLPVMLPGQGIWGGQQPPLYYVTGALLVQPFDLTDFEDYLERAKNPHASLGYALDPGNKNNYLHEPGENFPYRGLSLTVHVLRLYSISLGLIAVLFTYLTAFELASNSRFQVSDPNSNLNLRQNSKLRTQNLELKTQPSAKLNLRQNSTFGKTQPSAKLKPQPSAKLKTQNSKLFTTAVALFVACQPMFAFITASVTNEPANIAFSAIGLWLAQRYVLFGPSRLWGRAIALGIVLGLISLSKMTGLSFGLVVVVAILQTAIATRKQAGTARLLWRDGVIMGLIFLAVGGWWYWRNYQLYGDFFQRGLYKIYFNQEPQPLTLSNFMYHLSTSEVSFWATFGWLNLIAPDWVYSVYRIISRIGLLGVAVAAIIQLSRTINKQISKRRTANVERQASNRRSNASPNDQSIHNSQFTIHNSQFTAPHRRASASTHTPSITHHVSRLIIHLVFPIALAFSLTRLVALEGGLQGRQLLPALGSIAIVIVWGWWTLTPARVRRPVLGLLVALLFGLALWLPYTVVAREYIPSPLLTEADLPASLHRLDLTYNDEMKLIGVEIGVDQVRPGERAPVMAYWQALKPMTTNYSVFVHLIGRGGQNAGQFNTYPGLGLRPTTTLQPGQIVVDTYPVLAEGEAPTRLLVNIGLFDFDEPGRPGIEPTAPDGNLALPTVGQLKLIPTEWPVSRATPPVAQFADNIWLTDYRIENCTAPDDDCVVIFEWLARGRPSTDYTVFVQLWRNGEQAAGFDAPPLANDYSTTLWAAQEVILDPHRLDLSAVSPGEYQILAGLYNLATGERLPATAPDGTPLPDYAVDLGVISIKP